MSRFDGLAPKDLTMSSEEVNARRAAEKARKLLSTTWQPFLRMLTGNPKLRVQLTGGNPRTDGQVVYLRVPPQLGEVTQHPKASECGKRDPESSVMICEGCASEDEVFAIIYHESGHMVADSFQEVSEFDKDRALKEAVRLSCEGDADSDRAKRITKILQTNKLPNGQPLTGGYMPLAAVVNPYLPMLLNAAEDTRVNTYMISKRPGVRLMLDALFNKVWSGGYQVEPGAFVEWEKQPMNAQASIAVFCHTSGLTWRGKLHPWVEEALDDPAVLAVCQEIVEASSVRQVFKATLRTMEELQRFGFFRVEDNSDDGEDGEGEDGEGSGKGPQGPIDVGAEPKKVPGQGGGSGEGDDTDDDDEAEGDSPGKGDDSEDDDDSGKSGGGGDEASDEEGSDDDGDGAGGDGEADDDGDGGDSEGGGDGDSEGDGGDAGGDSSGPPEDVEWGDADASESVSSGFAGHSKDAPTDLTPPPPSAERSISESEIEKALNQAEHFDHPSDGLSGLSVYKRDKDGDVKSWGRGGRYASDPIQVPERILAPALQRARIAFTENRKGKHERNLRAGSRLDGRVLATRIAVDDPRLFQKRTRPKKRDYFAVIGLDVSGSTSGHRIGLIKEAAMAWCELFSRLGIKFAVYAHSGDTGVTIFEVKGPDEPWSKRCRERLEGLGPYSANLDGHTLEFYRKVVQKRRETDRLILYVTDGAMPAENYAEELAVLQENIKMCQRLGIKLVGIGIENSEPERHGLDTIRMDSVDDLPACVRELEKRLE